jgi:energy-coupling factor transport system permease protein
MIHSIAWVLWLVTAMVALSGTRNPLYLVLLYLALLVVYSAAQPAGRDAGRRPANGPNLVSPVALALVVVPLSALFNALTVHFGATVLFRLPQAIPVLGGPITLEATTYGLLNGLVLAGLLLAFATLNRALPVRALIRLVPQAFYSVAVVISIAVTFVPSTLHQLEQVRHAQAVRGHRVRGVRDWLPLLLPLLIGGLERALQLAEAMTARGFASSDPAGRRGEAAPQLAVVAGLVALLGGWLLRLVWGIEALGTALMAAGGLAILAVVWWLGRQGGRRTAYRRQRWELPDWAVALGAAVTVVALMLPGPGRDSLIYYPYPALSPPAFDAAIGLAILGLLAPAILLVAAPPRRPEGAPQSEAAAAQRARGPVAVPSGQPPARSRASWEAVRGLKSNGRAIVGRIERPAAGPADGRPAWRNVPELERAGRSDEAS